ncbi:hypothetical protein RvY_07246 [Ramazzottius varieornatus]|uniref:Uncharacterized protein n=1 Tax=Ramazzottius varieornatus TaxID=947166 RepID=A0A1D1V9Y4_RAMVA|nr:hypothetical protein RvY_07246 [Ramazzottius varieornatus]
MGGCTSSKMPNGEVATTDSRKGFSASSSMRKTSLLASENRLKNLAASDESTYEVVKGGRQASLPTDTTQTQLNDPTNQRSLIQSNEASSQTTSAQSQIKFSRPSQLLTPDATRKTTIVAPLATIETASELGTPTPMDENKSFSRLPGQSFLPQPGQQRPLLHPNGSLPRYGYSSPPSRLPALASFTKTPSPLAGTGVRPALSPRPPGMQTTRMAVPPSTLISQNNGDTDNVMISTSSGLVMKPDLQLTTNGGIPRPGSGSGQQLKSRLGSASGQKETSADSLKTSTSSITGSSKSLTPRNNFFNGSLEKVQATSSIGKESPLSHPTQKPFASSITRPSQVPPPVPAAFKPGLRPPQNNSTTTSPRGPLAQAAMSKSQQTFHQPQKPVRKISQGVSQLMATDSYLVDDGQSSQEEMAGDGDRMPHDDIKMFDIESGREKASVLPGGARRLMNGRENSESDYEDSNRLMERLAQDENNRVFSQGEELAEPPLMYHIDEFSLEEMISAVRDVKNLAQSLTGVPENSSSKMTNGHRNGLSDTTSLFRRSSWDHERLTEILKSPTKETLNDPDATFRLIIDLQSALREAISASHGS